jgi:hypothetical protein
LIRVAFNAPDRTATDDGREARVADGIQSYNSIIEMLEAENFDILYPTILPNGYEFTDFEVDDLGDNQTRIWLGASEPYISFTIRANSDVQIDEYDYEVNGIQYSIFESGNGTYVATWVYNGDYYTIDVSDRAVLSEIIENLRRH